MPTEENSRTGFKMLPTALTDEPSLVSLVFADVAYGAEAATTLFFFGFGITNSY